MTKNCLNVLQKVASLDKEANAYQKFLRWALKRVARTGGTFTPAQAAELAGKMYDRKAAVVQGRRLTNANKRLDNLAKEFNAVATDLPATKLPATRFDPMNSVISEQIPSMKIGRVDPGTFRFGAGAPDVSISDFIRSGKVRPGRSLEMSPHLRSEVLAQDLFQRQHTNANIAKEISELRAKGYGANTPATATAAKGLGLDTLLGGFAPVFKK